jgi:ankyrin repeat protein
MSDNLISHLTHSNSTESRNKTTTSAVSRLQELFGYIERREPRGVKEILQKNELKPNSILHAMEKIMKNYNPTCENTKEIIIALLSSKLDPDSALSLSSSKNHVNNTVSALTIAAQENDLKLARILIDFGCKVNDNINRYTLLVLINSNKGDISEFVCLLVNHGIDVNLCDTDGNSPLILATGKELTNVIKILLESNVDIDHKNAQGNTALHIAVVSGKVELVSLILKYKPDMNIVNKIGNSALDLGAQSTRTEIYALLAEEFNRKRDESEIEQKSIEDDNSYLLVNDNKQKVNNILNANNLSSYIGHTNNKYKNAKLQKLMWLQERKQDKDKKFTINSAQNSIEVPFNFQNVDKKGRNNQLHTYISKICLFRNSVYSYTSY